MTVAVVILGATGLALIGSGLAAAARRPLAARVDPYLAGLHGGAAGVAPPRARIRALVGRRLDAAWASLGAGGADAIAERLDEAGGGRDAAAFRIEQATWGLAGAIAAAGLVAAAVGAGVRVEPAAVPVLVALAFVTGSCARDWWLGRAIAMRRAALEEELPVAIDLVTLAIMAGASVPEALARAAQVLGSEMGVELERVRADVRAGAPVAEALERLRARVRVTGIARFVDALCIGIEKGTPLADSLRAQADDAREARRRLLLETGGRREILMLVPVVFIIMPVVVLFALYPGLVSLSLLVP